MKTFVTILFTALFAVVATWFIKDRFAAPSSIADSSIRKPLFYQSPMHPWIKSDKPGRCTICGMELVPIYPGEKGFNSPVAADVVALTQNQVQVVHVQTEEAKIQPLTRTLQVAGTIDDDSTRHRYLSAYIDGRIDKLHLNFMGAEVVAGQPLAEFYSPTLLQSEREYRQLSGDFQKNTALRLRQMGLTPEQISTLANKPNDALTSQILSPISGTVVAQNVYEGQYVMAGEKLFEIADFSTMWFMFNAYEQDMPWLKLGQMVTVTTPALPGKSFEGKVTFIDPNFEEVARATKVRVELANPKVDGQRLLLHRLYGEGAVRMDTADTLTAPRSAVIQTGPDAVVYIDQGGGAYTRTPVKIGRRGDTLLEILSGLQAGDKVVTNGNLLIDGQAEINRAFVSPASVTQPIATTVALTEAQQTAIREFVEVADAMAAALATDNLTAFNKACEPAMMLTGQLGDALAGSANIRERLEALSQASHLHGFENIESARTAFLKFTLASTAILEPMRKMKGFPALQIWECPMVSEAIPNAPKKAHWIQTKGRPAQNPFFGTAMQDCAKEIQP
ncbi:MAG: efflux RND transporter periplasmic adaptor subunit [Verrucomicrobiota bacterium]